MMLASLFKDYKPMGFFSISSILFSILGLISGIPVIIEFVKTSFVSKIPSAVLAVGFILVAILSLSCGLILDTIAKNNKKEYELYLNNYKNTEKKR